MVDPTGLGQKMLPTIEQLILTLACIISMLSPQEPELDRRRDNEVPGDPARGAHHAGLDGAEEQAGGQMDKALMPQRCH